MNTRSIRMLTAMLVACALLCLTAQVARAADDATGTWKWTIKTRNGQERTTTLKLKQEGEKLTGGIVGRNNQETEIQDGKVVDGQVTFKIVRKRNDREFVTSYSAKLDGDTLKGKVTTGEGDNKRERDWEAKREK